METIELAKQLISRESVTPVDAGCQQLMADRLREIGFTIESMPFGEVSNFWATRGTQGPVFVFAGHTDVVPPGPVDQWQFPPFEPVVHDGMLCGRGAADMKGSLAAMITATERFVAKHPHHQGSIGFLITSDEEGPFVDGTTRVVETLKQRNQAIDWCLVGEPSSTTRLGDVIKVGRRGSLSGQLTVKGKQGHVAYPHLADNAIHRALKALDELTHYHWDDGNDHFPPTSLQITQIEAGTATNVIPGQLQVEFNLRFNTEQQDLDLRQTIERLFASHQLNFTIEWKLNGAPFLTEGGRLVEATLDALSKVLAVESSPQTTGGTSDGRFIATMGAEVVELGPVNQTIHQVDERVAADDLEKLSAVYEQILVRLLS